jgi:predicted P-loop ATPase
MHKTFKVKRELLDLYTDAGLTLFQCDGFSKKPLRQGFKNTPFDPILEVGDQNYGVLLKSRYVVIDVDKRSFQPENDKPVSRLFQDLQTPVGIVNQTFTVTTPSGGYHIYFSKLERVRVKGSLKKYPGLEFKEHFIMAAGSYNEEKGKNYEVKRHSPSQIQRCPERLLALLTRGDDIDIAKEGLLTNHPSNIQRFTDIVSNGEPAIQGKGGDSRTFAIAAIGKDYGLSWDKTYELMAKHFNPRCQPEWSNDELEVKIKNAYNHGYQKAGCKSIENEFDKYEQTQKETEVKFRGWDLYADGRFRNTLHNAVQILTTDNLKKKGYTPLLKDKLQFNLFNYRIEFAMAPPWRKINSQWTDSDAIQVKHYLSSNWKFDPPVSLIHEAVVTIASNNAYHPVRDYIRELKWDKAPRLDHWLTTLCGADDNELHRFYARKTLIAAVSRVFKPGCKFDHVLVLEGDQGKGKSLLCQILGDPWFSDAAIDVRNKDAIDSIQGKWIIELAEMYAVSKYENKAMRRFISSQVDRYRPAYARNTDDYPRQSIFIGTVNPEAEGYLKDAENRRYWPVPIMEVNILLAREIRDQLMAEAYVAYMKGETIHVHDAKIAQLTRDNVAKRRLEDPWLHTIDNWLELHYFDYYDKSQHACVVQPLDIFVSCIGGNATMFSFRESIRITGVLKQIGFVKQQRQEGGSRKTSYIKTIDKFVF